MKKKGLRKLICTGLAMVMTLGLTACGGGGQTVGADPALAKQYVYSYENIEKAMDILEECVVNG